MSFSVDKINSLFLHGHLYVGRHIYITSKDKCRIILSVFKRRTVIKNNDKNQPIDFFHRFDVGDDKLHDRNHRE